MRVRLSDGRIAAMVMLVAVLATFLVYRPGLTGGFLFDDYPNIVDNADLHVREATTPTLVRAAMSSPSSDLKRPLASLTFAVDWLIADGDPSEMKTVNLAIHLLNGIAFYFLALRLFRLTPVHREVSRRPALLAAIVATSWLLLPINLTSVLYIVQRMESLANLFVVLSLLGYVVARERMGARRLTRDLVAALASLTVLPLIGLLSKENAVMAPLYAFLIELMVFRGRSMNRIGEIARDRRIAAIYTCLLLLPFIAGLAWLLPGVLSGRSWARRDFTLSTRLLSELRVVVDYIGWTLVPSANDLSFYHDDFRVSVGWLEPPTTIVSAGVITALVALAIWARKRLPLLALGIALYFAAHVMTATIIPLELAYEHRNYFASFGLLVAVVPLLVPIPLASGSSPRLVVPRWATLGAVLLYWTGQTAVTATAWSSPLSLAEELAARAPNSGRAQYELGRLYIILSGYHLDSPFARRVYAPLERAAEVPGASILPEQALIFFNARTGRASKPSWWDSIDAKLAVRKPSVQDESALGSLANCLGQGLCHFDAQRLTHAFIVGLSHPNPTARLQAMYSDYASVTLHDLTLAVRMIRGSTEAAPREPAYRQSLAGLLIATGDYAGAEDQLRILQTQNVAGALDGDIAALRRRLDTAKRQP